jgi:hypothetical protein
MSHLTPVPSDPEGLRDWLNQRREIELPPAPGETRALTVYVELQGAEPAVWRRLVVPGDTTLDRLHEVLQAAMGWTDSHLHRFFTGTSPGATYFLTQWDLEEGEEGTPESEVRLDQLLQDVGDSVLYEYDFGDSWDHELRLEKVQALAGGHEVRCTHGAGACPPEDVGGIPGYAQDGAARTYRRRSSRSSTPTTGCHANGIPTPSMSRTPTCGCGRGQRVKDSWRG